MIPALLGRLERARREESFREASLLFLIAWSARLVFLLGAAAFVRISWKNLALMYDGHLYILIAKSAPRLYRDIPQILPRYRNSKLTTAFFPVYPCLIALAGLVVGDLRVAALMTSQLLSSAAVVFFYYLARRLVRRPFLAALLFCFFPASWLVAGSLALVESAYVFFFLAAFYFFLEGSLGAAALFAAIVVVTQKSGALILPIFGLISWLRGGSAARGRLAWIIPVLAPLALLQGYLWMSFGSPWINVESQKAVFGSPVFAVPFRAMAEGLAGTDTIFRGQDALRKSLIGASFLFYSGVCAWGWRRRTVLLEPVLIWLSVVLLFNLCLGGRWGFYSFPRFMTLAAPAALLLLVDRLPAWPPRAAAVASAVLLALAAAAALMNVRDYVALSYEVWPAGYFDDLVGRLI